jgi:hypothetical protein
MLSIGSEKYLRRSTDAKEIKNTHFLNPRLYLYIEILYGIFIPIYI